MVSKYNQEYFFIDSDDEINNLPWLSPSEQTTMRPFTDEALIQGTAPLFFSNGYKEKYNERREAPINPVPQVLFYGTYFAVTTDIWRELLKLHLSYLHMHPAVYIHDDEEWHEDYWFCAFSDDFDCWDRDASQYTDYDDITETYGLYAYSLDTKVLDATPLEQRLLFEMGKSSNGIKVCHESIKHLFDVPGVKLIPIEEYGQ